MRITEQVQWETTGIEEGVIKHVKVLGRVSANNRLYPQTVTESSLGKFNALVNLNHNKNARVPPLEARIGKLVNATNEADGVYADLHILTKHPYGAAVIEAAQTMPDVMAL